MCVYVCYLFPMTNPWGLLYIFCLTPGTPKSHQLLGLKWSQHGCLVIDGTTHFSMVKIRFKSSSNWYMGVSINGGTPKSSILIGFSIINHPFWGTFIFGNTHIANHFFNRMAPSGSYRMDSIRWCENSVRKGGSKHSMAQTWISRTELTCRCGMFPWWNTSCWKESTCKPHYPGIFTYMNTT